VGEPALRASHGARATALGEEAMNHHAASAPRRKRASRSQLQLTNKGQSVNESFWPTSLRFPVSTGLLA